MTEPGRKPYEGKGRRLVVSIDVGTTFTAASFCILQEGRVPKFEEILRWPKQANPDAKVPSVLYYDKQGVARAFGAETEDEETIVEAEEGQWHKAEWWKLHLRPSHLSTIRGLKLHPLPKKISAEEVLTDYLRYIKEQVKEYITSTYGDGRAIWTSLSPSTFVILTTPNGWEGAQQNQMRQAAIRAGLVDADGGRRVRFVTEAEAAVLYAIDGGCVGDWLVEDGHLILCDCGGGTIDITGYKIASLAPLKLEESSASRCYLAGAVFITQAARQYLKKQLKGTEWGSDEAIQRAVNDFDRNAKRKFDGPENASWVNLNGFKTIAELGIIRGRLKIPGEDMAKLFEPSIKSIKEGLDIAFENGNRLADKVILVGGLASSPYVYSTLVKWGDEYGISVSRPDGPTTKAVANGALAWYVDNSVGARVSKYEYGTDAGILFDEKCKDSKGRSPYTSPDGIARVANAWNVILPKDTRVESTKEFVRNFDVQSTGSLDAPLQHSIDIYAYRRAKAPKFVTFPGKNKLQPGFDKICKVTAHLTQCRASTPAMTSKTTGTQYRAVNYDVCLSLGATELTARIRWKENDEWAYGPATVAYD
ncbi:hypothetical protein JAAARDRAFT_193396 [Jaapia argillacea MUCL 33604]|uniref:Uncharacterized protein n=1 Tax=Jaapia argillacea MUCL 33604 TaxID=933084 RepID=A0A067Q350_9AGAM|nr:hypothetical protein JAAARDRAFT_193396 [Jaapia argillacea MUCL 33604]